MLSLQTHSNWRLCWVTTNTATSSIGRFTRDLPKRTNLCGSGSLVRIRPQSWNAALTSISKLIRSSSSTARRSLVRAFPTSKLMVFRRQCLRVKSSWAKARRSSMSSLIQARTGLSSPILTASAVKAKSITHLSQCLSIRPSPLESTVQPKSRVRPSQTLCASIKWTKLARKISPTSLSTIKRA